MTSNIKTDVSHLAAILVMLSLVCFLSACSDQQSNQQTFNSGPSIPDPEQMTWQAPDSGNIPDNDSGRLILYGMNLVRHTANYFGPKGTINRSANGMNCQNCHLDAGTRLYANSYSAVYANYPKYRSRSGTVEYLEKRINDCMERSLNGQKLDSLSYEMRAFVAYINWVGKDVKKGTIPEGASVVDLPWLFRAADRVNGKIIFQKNCVTCHGADGQGKRSDNGIGYTYPPLWGPHSYNTGAGLYRLTRLAGFIKSNMPNLISTYDKPALTDEEAWDVAAYICSMPRPHKQFKNDWPDIAAKPVDYPYGPYADHFPQKQHKYGPYKEILMALQYKAK